ncbi:MULTISPECIES: GNAT family N-acetyltransferase [Halolamina]|uniref:Protein N-acetyltransferase, RimJ/RimL family n=1 Tax=Halolamina pelagica TaxID=699431 RepID=A0A1I5QNV2_9EURY|nr:MULTISPECIES: GNAT family protein [Halolamina]NHX35474.1 GNAT family N-acetyltransferase [Halolamina sp. R1-12]SFP47949.1 Protein N-acetyltransferase, RimJ/RimL family [Halolamina pelagica]
MFPATIETERLRLEPRTPEYVDPFEVYEHCKQGAPHIDEITEYLPWDPHATPNETAEFLERGAEAREEREGIDYVIRPREGEAGAGEIAGFGGLTLDWDTDSAELGTWLRKPFWGRGYSGERALALAELAFEHLDFEVVTVTHDADNEQSGRAIEKYVDRMGGRREGTLRNYHAGDPPVDAVRYSVTQSEYRDASPEFEVAFYGDEGEAWP